MSRTSYKHPRENEKVIIRVYKIIMALTICVNMDGGIVPSALDKIESEYGLEPWQIGLIGSLPYYGITASSPYTGSLLQRFSQQRFIVGSLILNCFFCICMVLSQEWWQLAI